MSADKHYNVVAAVLQLSNNNRLFFDYKLHIKGTAERVQEQ